MTNGVDVLVIGAGLAGLTAAWQAAEAGKRVRLVAKGWGATHWHSGCIDVLGYGAHSPEAMVDSLLPAVTELVQADPKHPYALVGLDGLQQALGAFRAVCREANYPLQGSLAQNWRLPSAAGAIRPTCLAPATMVAGDLNQPEPMLIVGFQRLGDFYAGLAAANLRRQGISAEGAMLELESLNRRRFVNPVLLAQLFDSSELFRAEVAQAVKPLMGDAARIGFPAVLGLAEPLSVKADLEDRIGRTIFEIPTLPPSVAGMRLHQILVNRIKQHGGRIFDGLEALGAEVAGARIRAIYTEAAARRRTQQANAVVLATGGLLGGGIVTDHQGRVREVVLDLPLLAPPARSHWFQSDFFAPDGHPIYRVGVAANRELRPIDDRNQVLYQNLWIAGTTFANCALLRRRSFEGVALATGYWAGKKAAAHEAS